MSKERVRWGLLAGGAIAKAFARGLAQSETGVAHAIASRDLDKAEAFGEAFGIPRRYGSYDALLADTEIEAVYVSTPHPLHAEWAIKAAEAGKHVLVEKPMGLNAHEVDAMQEAALASGVFLMEAFMYRCHPQTAELVRLIREGAVGDVRVIQATFSFASTFQPTSRLWSNDLAGGGILDVGCYTVSMSRLIAGAAAGRPFAEPVAVTGAAHLHPETGVDAWALGTLRFPGDVLASVATGIALAQENVVRVFGSEGSLVVPSPWAAARDGAAEGRIEVRRRGEAPREVVASSPVTSFTLEADAAGRAIRAGRREPEPPAMTWADSLGNARALDAWRAAVGLVYASEQPERGVHTVSRRPLAVRSPQAIPHGRVELLDKPVARLVMGVDNQLTMPHFATVADAYFERGGNAFDTAWVYGRKRSELLGWWMRHRGVRDRTVVIAKGAHTPQCDPVSVRRQLLEQLEWLQTDCADIYFLHRDNPDIPVGEFVSALNDLVREGRVRVFGGSNWTVDRVRKANAYAKRKGLQGFSAVSNNLSLAVMNVPVWAGALHAHDAASLRWFRRTRTPLFPWSSQARGFFLPGRAHPDRRDDPELVRCWYSADNFRRLERARELAERHGVAPINIALAWVLRQTFPVFPLIGPRTLGELRTSLPALDVELSRRDLAWLDLEA